MTTERERIPVEEVLRLFPQKVAEKARYWRQLKELHAAEGEWDDAAETGEIALSYESAIEKMILFLEAIRVASVEIQRDGWEATVLPDWWTGWVNANMLRELALGTDENRLEWARSLFHRK